MRALLGLASCLIVAGCGTPCTAGCPALPTSIVLTAVDVSTSGNVDIAAADISIDGYQSHASDPMFLCSGAVVVDGCMAIGRCTDSDAATGACKAWDLSLFGAHTIKVSAAGYQPVTFQSDVESENGCCSYISTPMMETLKLTKQI